VSWFWGSSLAERNGATVKWDDVQQVPYAQLDVGGTFEWLFLENARSFGAKLTLMREKKLRGFSAWVLGPEDPGIWSVLGKR
jgi:spore germination protein YaaH